MDIEEKLVIDVGRLDPEGETLSGEVACVDLNESFVKAFGGVRYRLDAQVLGRELLVRGHLEQDFDLVCSRCGKDFDDTVVVDDFVQSFEIVEGATEIDITEDVRQSVILALPTYPVCDGSCKGVEQTAAKMPEDSRWSALDGVKVGK